MSFRLRQVPDAEISWEVARVRETPAYAVVTGTLRGVLTKTTTEGRAEAHNDKIALFKQPQYVFNSGFAMNYPPLSSPPQDDGNIRVDGIEPKWSNDTLKVSAVFKNLFSRKIIGTIQSGLPSIIQIEIKLTDLDKKNIAHAFISRTIKYDIWEEQYYVEWGDTTLTFANLDKVMETCGQLQNAALAQTGVLNPRLKYVIQMRVAIIPITTKQADKVSSWLLNPNQTEESVASQNRASGFKMNLNKLVSFFLGSKKKSRYSSEWRSSKPFTPIDLKP